jgi:hypothetical protein
MALVVEDGTGLANANSYASVNDADAYFADRGNQTWAAASDDDKSSALIGATDYIDTRYAGQFIGSVEFPETPQALAFPRTNMYSWIYGTTLPDGVPSGVVKATYEYAVRWLTDRTLAPDPAFDSTNRLPTKTVEQVGPIREEYDYNQKAGAIYYNFRPWPYADALLKPYIRNSGGGVIRN